MTPAQIKRLRQRHGLSQNELGLLLGHSDNGGVEIRRWEGSMGKIVVPSKAGIAGLRFLDAILTTLQFKRLPGLARSVLADAISKGKKP